MRRFFVPTLVITLSLLGCSESKPTGSSSEFRLAGIWNADLELTENGVKRLGAASLRFDRTDSGWKCLLQGNEAQQCDYSSEVSSFVFDFESAPIKRETYTESSKTELKGLSRISDDAFSASYERVVTREYTDGQPRSTSTTTGTARLFRVESYDREPAKGLRLLGEFNQFTPDPEASKNRRFNQTANVRVKGDYAYLARFGDGLRVVNVANPANMTEVGHAPVRGVEGAYFNDVKLFSARGRDYAALSDSRMGLIIYDVTDPTKPTYVSKFFSTPLPSDFLNNHTSFTSQTTAYLGNYAGSKQLDPRTPDADHHMSGGLLIVDLEDPAQPRELGRWLPFDLNGTTVHDLYVEEGIAYLNCWGIGLVVLDVRDPKNPKVLGQFKYERMTSHSVWVTTLNGRRLAAHGDEDFDSHLRIVDVTPDSPDFMKQIGEFKMRPQVSVHNIMAIGNEVFATWYQDGLRILDISDPKQPKLTAWFNSWPQYPDPSSGREFYEGAIGIDIVGPRIYLVDINRGLLVLERTE